MNDLNERQKELYEWMLKASEINKGYLSKEFICIALSHLYPRYLEKNSEHNSKAYSLLRRDIRALNGSDEIHKIIVSSKKGYKLATKEEAEIFIKKRFIRDLRNLKLNHKLKKKCGLDGQIDAEMNEIKAFVEV